jgi:hypothetical protein
MSVGRSSGAEFLGVRALAVLAALCAASSLAGCSGEAFDSEPAAPTASVAPATPALCADLSRDLDTFVAEQTRASRCSKASDCIALAIESNCGSSCRVFTTASDYRDLESEVTAWLAARCPAECETRAARCETRAINVTCRAGRCLEAT